MTAIINLQHTRGDTFIRSLTFADSAGADIDLTGSTITMTVKRKPEDATYIAQGNATLANQTTNTGEATITLAATLFNVECGQYVYDIQKTDSVGTIVTFMKGVFDIVFDVT